MDLLNNEIVNILTKYSKGGKASEDVMLADLRIDSLNMIRVIVDIEAKYKIKFEGDKLSSNEFVSVKGLIAYVSEKLNEKEII